MRHICGCAAAGIAAWKRGRRYWVIARCSTAANQIKCAAMSDIDAEEKPPRLLKSSKAGQEGY